MTTRRYERRDTAANWTAANPVLAQGEIGVELGAAGVAARVKIGDGTTAWATLPYQDAAGVSGLASEQAARIAADALLVPLTQRGAASGVGVLGTNARPPANYGNFADVTRAPYYATGDGITDDTAAIASCLAQNLRVYIPRPPVGYKCGSLSLRPGHRLAGDGRGGDAATTGIAGGSKILSQAVYDGATSYSRAGLYIQAGGVGLGAGIIIEGLWLEGKGSTQPDTWTQYDLGTRGVFGDSQTTDLTIRDCRMHNFGHNIWLLNAQRCQVERCLLDGSVAGNLVLQGQCYDIGVSDTVMRVANEIGQANVADQLQNVWLRDNAGIGPINVTLRDCTIDEVATGAQSIIPAGIRIDRATNVLIDATHIYTPVKSTAAPGGYGIKIGANAKRVRVKNTRIEPYIVDAYHVPLNTILIDAAATETVLEDVTTNPNTANGGSDISDLAADTVWRNVNGITRFRKGITAARPSAATYGAGGHWYDTTIGKPIISDGTVWRDFAGTAV